MFTQNLSISKGRIYGEIVSTIKNLVLTGEILPGDKLPTEKALAESFGVSKATVREAMSVLESAGIVDIYQGRGTYISKFVNKDIINPLADLLLVERDSTKELLEVREILEVRSAGLAARNIPENVKQELINCTRRMTDELEHGDLALRCDLEFHYFITLGSQNQVLIKIMNSLYELYAVSIESNRQKTIQKEQRKEQLIEEHTELAEAVCSGDVERAENAMRKHFESLKSSLRDSL